jgi:hypothetical protein
MSKKEKDLCPREFLPIWAKELLQMQDDAKRNHKAEKSSSQEDSSLPHPP